MLPGVNTVIVATGIVVAGYAFNRWRKKSTATASKEQYEDICREILSVRGVTDTEIGTILPEVKKTIKLGLRFSDLRLSSIFRVECIYEKREDEDYLREILVYVTESGRTKVMKIRQHLNWAYLPSDVRKTFIRDRLGRVSILIYERKDNPHE